MSEAGSRSEMRRPRRAELAKFYGEEEEEKVEVEGDSKKSRGGDPFDINGPNFDAEAFSQRLVREASLSQLMAQEAEVSRQVAALDSDMQTLVYENYNRFIAATDTIRKMRVDFRAMEDEMDRLADEMGDISASSARVGDALRERRRRIGQLSGTHTLLRKLQFLFELPARLKACVSEEDGGGDPRAGVMHYLRAQQVLEQYEHMPSFAGIKADCDATMVELRRGLLGRLRDPGGAAAAAPEELSLYVDLLLRLREDPEELCDAYLSTAAARLQASLEALRAQVRLMSGEGAAVAPEEAERPSDAFVAPMDILEFVDHGCNTFVSDLCLVIASYTDTFLQDDHEKKKKRRHPRQQKEDSPPVPAPPPVDPVMAEGKLVAFVEELTGLFFEVLRARLQLEKKSDDASIRVRALDRFHRRIQAMNRLLPSIDFSRAGLDLVLEASEMHCKLCLERLEKELQEALVSARKALVSPPPRRLAVDASDGEPDLAELNSSLLASICDGVRAQISDLQPYVDADLTFAAKTYFRSRFGRFYVREGVMVAFFARLADVAHDLCEANGAAASAAAVERGPPQPPLLLLLSRTCLDLAASGSVGRLVSQVDELFSIDESSASQLTPSSRIEEALRSAAQALLDAYVRAQGDVLSQMLRRSVETRDWLNTVEPRTVRAVMKRVVEEMTTIDRQVGKLYEEGTRKARSSDSSRRTRPMALAHSTRSGGAAGGRHHQHPRSSSNWSVANSQPDAGLASNIQRMFSDRVEIFSPVEASRASCLTGVVKIALKSLLECVRLRTFGRFGFQQVQVDARYLQLYLWRFVSDENLVSFLLDEVMTSAVHRCADPSPMEASVVDVICDRG